MRDVDVSIVTHEPEMELLRALIASLAEPARAPARLALFIEDNSPDPGTTSRISALPELQVSRAFARVEVRRSGSNLGFGRGHNANAARGGSPWLLLLNQDCVLEPGALDTLLDAAISDAEAVAAWEMRQVPYEHPKGYDPATLATPWVSGAAVLLRRSAFLEVNGFDEHFFLYGEDVDLSWRLRARGWKLRYVPRAAVVHRTYAAASEVKPLQVFGSVYASLAIRLRYGSLARVAQGLGMLGAELVAPSTFPGRRAGLVRALARFLWHAPHFLLTPVRPTEGFRPFFAGWGYEVRRDGAFHEFTSRRGAPDRPRPLVSILIRTVRRPVQLREALASCVNQTYPHLEVVVIEDGDPASKYVVDEFAGRLDIRYRATGRAVGRARAGNLAMREARGEWLNFLDDDDVLFADHVEVLVDAATRSGLMGAYSLAWETQVVARPDGGVEEVLHSTRHHQRFDRLTLWHHNYLPIQAVLFHRSLFERLGGLAEDMDLLEDWNLWTRYTLEHEFVFVEKTTSKYRLPATARVAAERQAALDRAYADAIERQRALQVTLSPREISEMADAYVRSQSVMMVTRSDLRRFVGSNRLLARIASWRQPTKAWMRRRGLLR
jgi:GT2 family glycosyltransferase